MGKSGIYTITCKINNKIYVGETEDLRMRKFNHFSRLKYNTHSCKNLQDDFNLYGENNFIYEKLLKCKKKYLLSEENYWCNMLDTHNPKYGYNIRPTNPNGNPSMAKISLEKSALKRMKPVITLSTNGKFIKRFRSVKDASLELILNASMIAACARGDKYAHNKGYVFVYENDYIPEKDYSVKIQRRKNNVLMMDENQIILKKFDSPTIAAEYIKGSQASIWRAINGTRKTYKNYYWKYGNNRNEILV